MTHFLRGLDFSDLKNQVKYSTVHSAEGEDDDDYDSSGNSFWIGFGAVVAVGFVILLIFLCLKRRFFGCVGFDLRNTNFHGFNVHVCGFFGCGVPEQGGIFYI